MVSVDKGLEKLILQFALANALQYGGKANAGAVIGKIIAAKPELKENMAGIGKLVSDIVKDVNEWGLEKQGKELKKIGEPAAVEKKERKGLPELEGAKMGKVVTRIPPEPSKYTHIGHAISFLINYLYAKKYKGKCILRFEDTNPEKSNQEYVDAFKEDILGFLEIKPDKIVFSSNDLEKMYSFAEKLIENENAYVCTCAREKIKDMRHKGEECECRVRTYSMELWKKMLKGGFGEEGAVLRLKLDMKADNQTLRDPVIFRVCLTPHFKLGKKFKVWPLYDFQNVVEDELCGITHILRSAEFGEMRIELQNKLKELLGFNKQFVMQYGRFGVEGAITQGREIRKLIEEGKVSGWDDPRLVTIKALKKRGYVKETFFYLAQRVGLRPGSATFDWNIINSENRKHIDKNSNRYFFVAEPIQITLSKIPTRTVSAPLYPGKRKMRKIPVSKKVFVDKIDFIANRGKEVRLMHFANFVLDKEAKYTGKPVKDIPKIHWVPEKAVKAKLVMDTGAVLNGLAEPAVGKIKAGETLQFERIGFCRVDSTKPLVFYFAHK
ncbi:MAG: glutamate--tRNA ligase [Candidatus Aenigmarchaeota archaeon]|nr:glutamate--tRNA ligase [Candidatus Aenigmarchaeota archaeon]